jgi:hypothetical protein
MCLPMHIWAYSGPVQEPFVHELPLHVAGKDVPTHLLMLRLFRFEPKRPCKMITGESFLAVEGSGGCCRW